MIVLDEFLAHGHRFVYRPSHGLDLAEQEKCVQMSLVESDRPFESRLRISSILCRRFEPSPRCQEEKLVLFGDKLRQDRKEEAEKVLNPVLSLCRSFRFT